MAIILLAVFLSAPYHIFNGYVGPALDNRFGFAALGLLFACFSVSMAERYGIERILELRGSRVLPILGVLLFSVSAAWEIVDYPLFLQGDMEGSALLALISSIPCSFEVFLYLVHGERWAILVGSFCLASSILLRSDDDRRKNGERDEPTDAAKSPRALALLVSVAVIALLGFSSRSIWAFIGLPMAATGEPYGGIAWVLIPCAVFLAIVWAFLVVRRTCASFETVAGSSGVPPWRARCYRCLCFAALAIGMLGWSALTRVIPIANLGGFSLVTLAVTALITIIPLLNEVFACRQDQGGSCADRSVRAGYPAGPASRLVEKTAQKMRDASLSPRETEFIISVLEGVPSARIAEMAGVKPSTVRSTLHRAYKKLNVAGEAELRGVFALQDSVPSKARLSSSLFHVHRARARGDDVPSRHEALRCLQAGSLCVSAFCFLCPPGFEPGRPWGYGGVDVLGIAAGCVLVGMCLHLGDLVPTIPSPAMGPGSVASRREPWDAVDVRGMVLLAVVGLPLYVFGSLSKTASFPATGVTEVLVSAAATCLLIWSAHRYGGGFAHHDVQRAGIVISLLTVECLASRAGGLVCVVVGSVAYAGFVASCFCTRMHGEVHTRSVFVRGGELDRCKQGGSLDIETVCLGAVLGVMFEEAWRSVGTDSFAGTSSLAMAVAWLFSMRPLEDGSRAHSVLVLVGCLAAIAIAFRLSLPFAAMLIGAMTLFELFESDDGSVCIGFGLMSFGCSSIFGMVLVNGVQDAAFMEPLWVQGLFGGGKGLSAVFGLVLFSLSFVTILFVRRRSKRVADDRRALSRFAEQAETPSALERRAALLRSHGLSDLQVAIMLSTAAGKTAPQIAEEQHYSVSAVKSLRSATYRQLSLQDVTDLVSFLSQVDGV